MPARLRRTIRIGTDWGMSWTWYMDYDEATDTLSAPKDLTDWTASMDLRRTVGSADRLMSLTTANSRIALGGTDGTITFQLTNALTSVLPPGPGFGQLEMINSESQVIQPMEVSFQFAAEGTR